VQKPRAQQFYENARPQQKAHHNDDKPKKPVAQILRKYREENEDGSITWFVLAFDLKMISLKIHNFLINLGDSKTTMDHSKRKQLELIA
jgi:hypothetical protein